MTTHHRVRLLRGLLAAALLAVGLATSSAATAAPPPGATGSGIDLDELSRLAVGYTHACGIDGARDLYCWGTNASGELGTGTTTASFVPVAVAVAGTPLQGKDIERVAAGREFTCALTTDDVVACWGDNSEGQLGIGSNDDSLVPVAVTETGSVLDGANIVALSSQYQHICARTAGGAVACWGLGSVGQLANGAVGDQTVPTDVDLSGTPLAGTTVAEVSAGSFNTCLLGADGTVGCAGSSFSGALGNGTTGVATKVQSPTTAGTVLEGKSIDAVTTGRYSTCVTTTDDVLACWGIGDDGQMGDGETTNNTVPGPVTTAG
ncbi:MAG: hypothetical protein KDB04_06270, partial [Acidimicrobiales bacterium]|nr:hypothetical protein [Acidimicrobiales bacterium]